MADKTMKTLTIGSNIYEIVDEYARNKIDSVESTANEAAQTANNATNAIKELPDTFVTKVNGETGDVTIDVPVKSVNGRTGNVTIDVPVTSVNKMTGDVTINIPVTSVNGKTGDVVIDIPEPPVTSVNNQTGDVTIPVRTAYTTTLDVPIDESEWEFNSEYVSYTHTFEDVEHAFAYAEMYVDCLMGSNFPILGARCETDRQVIIYMAYPPTVSQTITLTFKTEV